MGLEKLCPLQEIGPCQHLTQILQLRQGRLDISWRYSDGAQGRVRNLGESRNGTEGGQCQESDLEVLTAKLHPLKDYDQDRPKKNKLLAAGVLGFKDDAAEQPDSEPHGAPVEEAGAFAGGLRTGLALFVPEKQQNKD